MTLLRNFAMIDFNGGLTCWLKATCRQKNNLDIKLMSFFQSMRTKIEAISAASNALSNGILEWRHLIDAKLVVQKLFAKLMTYANNGAKSHRRQKTRVPHVAFYGRIVL
jgi:hypothetical protein